jgi:dTDP-4-dehydrorhamnose reductase
MLRLRTERPELRIIADQHGAPTSADAIAEATRRVLKSAAAGSWRSGLYHMTAGGATTWYGFAKAIFARAEEPTPAVVAIGTAEYPTPAARPANSVLSNEKFAAHFGFRLPEWEQQLDAVMAARAAAR